MEKIEVKGSTVDFYKDIKDGSIVYIFDSSRCGPPEPMVNAMAGLQLLDENSFLIMINHKAPSGLFPKIENDFEYEVEDTSDGKVRVTFSKKLDAKGITDFTQNTCSGGKCSH